MSFFTKSIAVALTALAIGSVTLAPIAAEASPRHHGGGHHGGGHHGGGFPGGGYPGPYGGHGHHGGGWGGHGGGWGGGWGHGRWGAYPVVYNGGEIRRCKIVERVDVYGEVIGTRRVCRVQY
jgi:hypothetical protein